MANSFKKNLPLTIAAGLMLMLAISCQPKTRKLDINTMVDPELSKKINEVEMMKTCDNQLNTTILANTMKDSVQTIEDEIASKDLEQTNCQGITTWKGHGPEKKLEKMIEVTSPITDESIKVNFIQIENTRTCTVQRITPADDIAFEAKETTLEDGTKVPAQQHKTMANSKGNLKLVITDSILRADANSMNIRDGDNVIKIKYFGKCQKYKEILAEKYDDAFNCETAELIESKDIYINVVVKRPEVSGTNILKLCFDGDTKQAE